MVGTKRSTLVRDGQGLRVGKEERKAGTVLREFKVYYNGIYTPMSIAAHLIIATSWRQLDVH